MKDNVTFGLVCAGGGAHGAYQVGTLKYIHEHFSDGNHSPFRIFTGSSCGSLNTTFYAAQSHDARVSRLWLEELWLGFHVPAYHGNVLKNALVSAYKEWRKPHGQRNSAWSLLDPKPMRDVIHKGFIRSHLERSIGEGCTRGVAVAATEILSGRICWFQEGPAATTWNLFHSIGLIDKISTDHVAASCSVPVFLPPVKIGSRYYLDGSVSLDRPFSAALSMGATRILSIATDKPIPAELPAYHSHFKPRLSNVIRLLLNRLGHDAAGDEAVQLQMLNRFYQALSRRHRLRGREINTLPLFHEEALPAHYQPVKVYLLFPSKRIRNLSDGRRSGETPNPRKRTRFMFHEKFIRELIDLGYEDARAKHEELKNFFTSAEGVHILSPKPLFKIA